MEHHFLEASHGKHIRVGLLSKYDVHAFWNVSSCSDNRSACIVHLVLLSQMQISCISNSGIVFVVYIAHVK